MRRNVPIVLLIMTAQLASCGGESPGPGAGSPAEPIRLTTDSKQLTAFQGAFAWREDGVPLVLGKSEYDGTIGSTPLKLRASDGRLVFVVPHEVVGAVELRVTLDDAIGVLPLELLAPPEIPDPVAVVTTFFDEQQTSLDETAHLISDLVIQGKLPKEVETDAQALKAEFEGHREQFLSLPLEEQRVAALALTTFRQQIASHVAAGDAVRSALGMKGYQDLARTVSLLAKFLKHVGLFVAPVVVFGMAGGAPGAVLALLVFNSHLKDQKLKVIAAWSALADEQIRPIDLLMIQFKSDFEFRQGKALPIAFDVGWRNIQKSDESGSTSWLSALLVGIRTTNTAWGRMFPGSSTLEFRAPSRDVDDPHDLSAIEIVGLEGQGISCSLGGSPAAPTMTCESLVARASSVKFTLRFRYQVDEFTLESPAVSGELFPCPDDGSGDCDECVGDQDGPVLSNVRLYTTYVPRGDDPRSLCRENPARSPDHLARRMTLDFTDGAGIISDGVVHVVHHHMDHPPASYEVHLPFERYITAGDGTAGTIDFMLVSSAPVCGDEPYPPSKASGEVYAFTLYDRCGNASRTDDMVFP